MGIMKVGEKKKRGIRPAEDDGHLDLVPLIDCVFLILLFFILCGHISYEQRNEQITVPPTKTAQPVVEIPDWKRVVINIFGTTQNKFPAISKNTIDWNGKADKRWQSDENKPYYGYQMLRKELDDLYDQVKTYDDPKGTGMKLPMAIIEIRADDDTEYRVVQEVMQVVSDTINPNAVDTPDGPAYMQAKVPQKCFVNIDFTTRRPDDM